MDDDDAADADADAPSYAHMLRHSLRSRDFDVGTMKSIFRPEAAEVVNMHRPWRCFRGPATKFRGWNKNKTKDRWGKTFCFWRQKQIVFSRAVCPASAAS